VPDAPLAKHNLRLGEDVDQRADGPAVIDVTVRRDEIGDAGQAELPEGLPDGRAPPPSVMKKTEKVNGEPGGRVSMRNVRSATSMTSTVLG
jgi:hypothetical protein